MNPSSPRWSDRLVDAVRAGMLLAGTSVVLVGAWAIVVRKAGVDPVLAQVVAGLVASLLTVLVVE